MPSEKRVKDMTGEDYLWCLAQMMLDEEEELDRLCPTCRSEAEEGRCPACGVPVSRAEGMVNPTFDIQRFERLRGGMA